MNKFLERQKLPKFTQEADKLKSPTSTKEKENSMPSSLHKGILLNIYA